MQGGSIKITVVTIDLLFSDSFRVGKDFNKGCLFRQLE